jgi:NAD dependent epimerase/dehydratase
MLRSMKRALVTGAGGFIGSHLTEHLVRRGYRVRAFVRYNSAGRRGCLDESALADEIEFFYGDVRDHDAARRAVAECDTVFHLAALVGIPYSYVSPQAYVRTNVDGTLNVLEAAREHGTAKVVVTSTSEVYGTARYTPMDELHPIRAQSPYAATKSAADQLAISFNCAFEIPVVVARPFNTFGPRQSSRALIPTVISQLFAGDHVRLGSLHPTRDFTFVDDVVRGFVAIAESELLLGEAVHIGSGSEIAVGELAATIARLMGKPFEIDVGPDRVRPAASEVERLVCDSSKLRSRTDWSPEIDLEDGLRATIAWMEPRLDRFRAAEYSI